jgi:transposase
VRKITFSAELMVSYFYLMIALDEAFAEWRLRRVGVDYHVEIEAHFYSVPYRFARREVEVRLTPRTVEVFLKGERIVAHLRSSGNHRHTAVSDHMPSKALEG